MKKFTLMWGLSFCGLAMLSCQDQTFDPTEAEDLIVEAYLYSGQPVNQIKLTRLIPFIEENDNDDYFVNDAEVFIHHGEDTFPLILNQGDTGTYYYPGSDLEIATGKTFELRVEYFGKTIHATSIVPASPLGLQLSEDEIEIEPIEEMMDIRNREVPDLIVEWDNPSGESFYVLMENIEAESEPLDVNGLMEGFMQGRFRMITRPSPLDTYVIRGMQLTEYGTYRLVLFRVNQEYVDLYESTEQDSRFLNEPASNVENGLGIFTAFNSDTIYFEVKKP
ncbi:DUF4249 family protein [Xanthovirga aplysinae]|uniref:DUF4249 family protein n=1 Tax=Xanthovirga aplysinae TaxID=2529853 RepID=UPI0012BC1B65|nr:DUF4249 family protein [Xanthovirga aplysinae]MTI30876.1 DUF4249 family protein [Xanthovirga aplysinae]